MVAVTVEQLALMSANLVKGGKGKKKIMISSDDEGNEYHELFFGFTENPKDIFEGKCAPYSPVSMDKLEDYVILG